MPDQFTREEFEKLMESWTPAMRALAEQRLSTNYEREPLEHFNPEQAALLRAVLKRLIPEDEGIDLAGFIDWAVDKPLGRGDRQAGMPAEPELLQQGLLGIDQTAGERYGQWFRELTGEQQDAVLAAVANGGAPGGVWQNIPSDYFFQQLYGKALHGYFAHPRVWMRIGFPGASYPEGYLWLGLAGTKQRHERRAGWDKL